MVNCRLGLTATERPIAPVDSAFPATATETAGRDGLTQGQRATLNGRGFDEAIASTLAGRGFKAVRHKDWQGHEEEYGGEVLILDAPYQSIYGRPSRSQFTLISARNNLRVRIEPRWQQVHGTADEKLPFFYLNAMAAPDPVIIVIDGGGWREGAVAWLRRAATRGQSDRPSGQVRVMSLVEFIAWVNRL